uniref:Uncharacterized protein n=1 Tax=Anas platyrhynchos TaxID=8839 RepID=A0A8B9TH93_ANAPL
MPGAPAGALTSSAASHLHQHVLQSPPGSQDSRREWGALPCSVLCVPGTTASAPGYMSSLHPAPGCAPSNAILGLGRMEKLWGTAPSCSHCLPPRHTASSRCLFFLGDRQDRVFVQISCVTSKAVGFCPMSLIFSLPCPECHQLDISRP